MDGWPCFILQPFLLSYISGGHQWATGDKSLFNLLCYTRYLPGLFTLVLSDELAQDEAEAEDYDLESLEPRGRRHAEDDDDDATLVGRRGDGHETISNDVVFEIGDEDGGSEDEDENKTKKRRTERSRNENGQLEERRGLVESRED